MRGILADGRGLLTAQQVCVSPTLLKCSDAVGSYLRRDVSIRRPVSLPWELEGLVAAADIAELTEVAIPTAPSEGDAGSASGPGGHTIIRYDKRVPQK